MEIINHRISRNNENKVDSILNLSNKGIKSFELDLQLCNDSIVIYHNYTLREKKIFNNIENYSYKFLEELDIDNIDKLFLVLEKVNNLNIYFDIKGYNDKLIYLLLPKLSLVKRHNIFLQSFNYNFVKLITIFKNTHNLDWKVGYITASYRPDIKFKTDYLVIDKSHYKLYKNLDIPLFLYTVNSPGEIDSSYKIKGIFTDYPENFLS